MTNAEFHRAIRRIRWVHLLHYPLQALLMGGVVLAAGRKVAVGTTLEPSLATWPALLLLGALVPMVGVAFYAVYQRLRPNLRRPSEENLRIYQGRILLRDSALSLLALPMLASYVVTGRPMELLASAVMLLALSWQTAPSAQRYQRWLVQ